MTERKYIWEQPQRGRRDQALLEFTGPDGSGPSVPVLALPKGVSGELMMLILDAVRHAYQAGREDKAAELIPLDGPADKMRRIVHDHALGAVDQWAPGYTDGGDDEEQYYIALEDRDEANGVLVMAIRSDRHGEDHDRFRVLVLTERIE